MHMNGDRINAQRTKNDLRIHEGYTIHTRVFQVDIESKESVHSELGTLTCLVRSLKILLSAHESHSGQATVPIKNQSRTSL